MTAAIRYRLEIGEEALEQLRALPKETRRRIGQKLDSVQTDLRGDVKNSPASWGNIGCASVRTVSSSRSKTT